MNQFLSCLALAFVLNIASTAQADSIRSFTFTSTAINVHPGIVGPNPAFPISATVLFDVTTGQPVSSEIAVPQGTFESYEADLYSYDGDEVGAVFYYDGFGNRAHPLFLDIYLPVATLVNYSGGPICSTSIVCNGDASAYGYGDQQVYDINAAVLTSAPEPSSLVLLGTGLFAAIGANRRRFAV